MDYIDISNESHSTYINEIITIIKKNPAPNSTMNNFIQKIINQNNQDEYKILCNALFTYINAPQGGSSSLSEEMPENTTTLIEKINQIKSPIKIPYKNKLLIDEQFELKDTSEDIKYKYYLSFYIIDAINNTTGPSSGV